MSWLESLIGTTQSAAGRKPGSKTSFPNPFAGFQLFSGLPAYAMSGPELQRIKQETGKKQGLYGRYVPGSEQTRFSTPVLPPALDLAGAPGLGALSPAERAYEQEKTRIAQLTAQDPELQRYEKARQVAVAPGATPAQVQSAEDIGMQIWKQKYGGTPMAQSGGAVGINNRLMQKTFGYQTGGAPDQQIGELTTGPTPAVPQVDQALNPASPTFIGGEGAPLLDFTREDLTPELLEKYQQELLKRAK